MTHAIVAPPRQIGFWTCLALVIGNTIGTGIFLIPAALAPFGWSAIYGWLITIGGGLCLAYVFAVVDGIRQDKGNYPSPTGRTGLKLFARKHPWIIAGAVCGVAGTIVGFAAG